jgi:hypothetical protein
MVNARHPQPRAHVPDADEEYVQHRPQLAPLVGGAMPALFLSRFLYWTGKDSGKDSGQKLTDVSYRRAAGPCHPSQATAIMYA